MRANRLRTRLTDRSASAGDGGAVTSTLTVGSLVAVVASAVASVLAYGVVPDPVRIHWTLGLGSYHGPEFAPASLVLTAFPLLVAGIALGAYWVGTRFGTREAFDPVRPYYTAAVLGTLAAVLAAQAAVVLANLA